MPLRSSYSLGQKAVAADMASGRDSRSTWPTAEGTPPGQNCSWVNPESRPRAPRGPLQNTQTPSQHANCVRTCGILTHRGDSVNMERLMPLKEFLTFSEGRGVHRSTWRSTRFGQSRSRSGETTDHNLYWGFPGKGKV